MKNSVKNSAIRKSVKNAEIRKYQNETKTRLKGVMSDRNVRTMAEIVCKAFARGYDACAVVTDAIENAKR